MADLGELGTARAERDQFRWFGETMHVSPTFSDLRLIDFMEAAAAIDETDVTQGLAMTKDFVRGIVDEEDFATFWATCLANGQGMADLMRLVKSLVELTADRPTRRRSDSSSGRRKTGGNSKGGSSRKVIRLMEQRGRADLALIVEQAGAGSAAG